MTVWSFDASSSSERMSTWLANGVIARADWTFNPTNRPTSNAQYQFSFDVLADAAGRILLEGRRGSRPAGAINVFINAFQLVRRELRVLKIESADAGTVRLTLAPSNPTVEHRLESTRNLSDPHWTEVPGVTFTLIPDNLLEAIFAAPVDSTIFYRVVVDR